METLFSVGNIVIDKKENFRYRILSLIPEIIVLCQMDTSKLKILHVEKAVFVSLIVNNSFEIVENETNYIIDDTYINEPKRKKAFDTKLNALMAVIKLYEPEFIDLSNRKTKAEVNKIILASGMNKSTFWRNLREYLQSGMKKSALMDKRMLGHNKGKTYKCKNKPGRKSEYLGKSGVVLSNDILKYFEEALNDYKSGRQKTIKSAYNKMNHIHFTKTEIINGVPSLVLAPVFERPTYRQFYYYVRKNLSDEENEIIKTSKVEVRNNKRLLLSDIMDGVFGPGDMVEIDACEADVSLISDLNPNQSIGRPIVYFMIDVFSRAILAMSVSLDNNSILGITNLFLNLADDKKEYCKKYNINYDDERIWPSQIIPRRVRVDRGAEFKSNEFERICRNLNIEKNIVSGGSGSLKGLVEQTFHQMHASQNVHLENYGLIEKRYDSEHHRETTLDINQYTKMVINFVITHNQQYLETYRLTKEMIQNNIRSIPAELWKYGVEKYGTPRPITNKVQYYYDLMTTQTAKITRKGICYKGLYYLVESDAVMNHKMFSVGKKCESLEIKVDLRDISTIYYVRDRKVFRASLNKRISGNSEFGSLTVKQWDDYRKIIGKMKAEGKVYNEALVAYRHAVNELIMKEAKKNNTSKQKEMRAAREIEKQMISSKNKIANRLNDKPCSDLSIFSGDASDYVHDKNYLRFMDGTRDTTSATKITELNENEKRLQELKSRQDVTSLTDEEISLLFMDALENFDDDP